MAEPDQIRVKSLPRNGAFAGRRRRLDRRPTLPAPVDRIPDHGVPDRGEVDADLVRSPGRQATFNERCPRSNAAHRAVVGDRRFAAALYHRHPRPVPRRSRDRPDDASRDRDRMSVNDGQVRPLDRMLGELSGKIEMRPIGLGGDDQAGRVLVEAVNDTRPPRRPDR